MTFTTMKRYASSTHSSSEKIKATGKVKFIYNSILIRQETLKQAGCKEIDVNFYLKQVNLLWKGTTQQNISQSFNTKISQKTDQMLHLKLVQKLKERIDNPTGREQKKN